MGTTIPAVITRGRAESDQRARILRALAELVSAEGYDEVTVKQIIKRAHVSYKTFYDRYPGKEAAFIALFDTVVAHSEAKIEQRLKPARLTWPEQVITVLRTLVEQITADPILARAVVVDARALGRVMGDRYEHAIRAYGPLLRAGRQFSPRAGELSETLEEALAGAVSWALYQRLLIGEAERLPEVLPALIELVLGPYLGPAKARSFALAENPAAGRLSGIPARPTTGAGGMA